MKKTTRETDREIEIEIRCWERKTHVAIKDNQKVSEREIDRDIKTGS